MEKIKMHGPTMDGSGVEVNRAVPKCDELAYRAAGYEDGFKAGLQTAEEYGKAKAEAAEKAKSAKK